MLEAGGTATLTPSTVGGLAIDSAQVTASYANRVADIKELVLTGRDIKAAAAGTLALGDSGTSNLEYDVAVDKSRAARETVQSIRLRARRMSWARQTGPASNLTLTGDAGCEPAPLWHQRRMR